MMSQRITLQTTLGASGAGLKDVSLLTTGIEAEGHGIYLDDKTAEGAMKRLLGRSVKSYLRHDGAGSDRLGQEIGFFSGIYRAGAQIKASAFEFLDSFKKEAGATADKLLELATKVPDQFGISIVAEYKPVWVLADGTEMGARLGEPAPKDAVRPLPAMRILDIISADFVGRPAANPGGLFSKPAAPATPAVDATDAKQPATPPVSMSTPVTFDQAALDAKLAEQKQTLTAALEAGQTSALEALKQEHTAALTAKEGEIAALTARLADAGKEKDALTAALAAQATEHQAALEKAAADATAPLTAKLKELETYDARKLGVAPVKIARLQAQNDPSLPAPAATDGGKWDQYAALKASDPAKAELFYSAHLARK